MYKHHLSNTCKIRDKEDDLFPQILEQRHGQGMNERMTTNMRSNNTNAVFGSELGLVILKTNGAFLPRDPPRISMLTIFHNFAKKRRNKQKQRPTTHHIRSDADNILDQHDGTRSSNET